MQDVTLEGSFVQSQGQAKLDHAKESGSVTVTLSVAKIKFQKSTGPLYPS